MMFYQGEYVLVSESHVEGNFGSLRRSDGQFWYYVISERAAIVLKLAGHSVGRMIRDVNMNDPRNVKAMIEMIT